MAHKKKNPPLVDVKSEPMLDLTPVISASASKTLPTTKITTKIATKHQSKSANSTPITNYGTMKEFSPHDNNNRSKTPTTALANLRISVDTKKRHSRKLVDNTSREAGHTPPPQLNNVSRYSDLVQDIDKKQGPINWWNLKVKMPDDNTMNILSPHRIPVPATPTTPEYVMKTPDGLRISLLDVDIDDEKQLIELGITLDDNKKEYIHKLKREQELLEEKQKKEEKEKEQMKQRNDNDSDESDTLNYDNTIPLGPNQIHNVVSQPMIYAPKKNNTPHRPHDPSPPTILTYDWDTLDNNNDPYSSLEQYNGAHSVRSVPNNKMQQKLSMKRISLQDIRASLTVGINNTNRTKSQDTSNINADNITTKSFTSRRAQLSQKKKRHSDFGHKHIKRHKSSRRKSRKSGKHNPPSGSQSVKVDRMTRSSSVDQQSAPKKIKKRTSQNKKLKKKRASHHALGRKKKRKKQRQIPKSDQLGAKTAPIDLMDNMTPLNISQTPNFDKKRVRFSHDGVRGNTHNTQNKDKILDDILGNIGTNNNTGASNTPITPIKTNANVLPNIDTTNISLVSPPNNGISPYYDSPNHSPLAILTPPKPTGIDIGGMAGIGGLKLQIHAGSGSGSSVTLNSSQIPSIVATGLPTIKMPNLAIKTNVSKDKTPTDQSDIVDSYQSDDDDDDDVLVEEDEEYSDDDVDDHEESEYEEDEYEEDEYEDDEDDSYARHRYESSDSDDWNPGPLANPLTQMMANQASSENVDDNDNKNNKPGGVGAPSKIAMPVSGNKLNLGFGVSGNVVLSGGASSVVGNGGMNSAGSTNNRGIDRHLASSPLIMGEENISSFFSQFVPNYYTEHSYLLSDSFEIHQYSDLKNLNLYIYKTLRVLHRDDLHHPTLPTNIKMKFDQNWELKIDRIASCHLNPKLMTNLISYFSIPNDNEYDNKKKDKNSKKHQPKKHLLGMIKATQSYTLPLIINDKNINNKTLSVSFMANSVTPTPRVSGVTGSSNIILQPSPNIKDRLTGIGGGDGLNILTLTPNEDEAFYTNELNDLNELDIDDNNNNDECSGSKSRTNKNDSRSCCKCKCFSIHNLRKSLIINTNNKFQIYFDWLIYNLLYKYGSMLLFLFIYLIILGIGVAERLFISFIPNDYQIIIDLDSNWNVIFDDLVIIITGRIMLISLILLIISRLSSCLSYLNNLGCFNSSFVKFLLLDSFIQYKYIHLLLSWCGILIPLLIHIIFILFTPFSSPINNKNISINNKHNQSFIYSMYHDISHNNTLYIYDLVRILSAFIIISLIILSNYGSTYYSKYRTSSSSDKRHNHILSICCNKSFDYGHEKKRYKLLHILSGTALIILFYCDLNYINVYYIVSFFILLLIIDRIYLLFFSENIHITTDLNIIEIDHQFKLLFINLDHKSSSIRESPGDIFYISRGMYSFGRPSIFFRKNNNSPSSFGCILRVHRENTLMWKMERVLWNFNLLESILDNEIKPVFRGPFRNNIYNKLIHNIEHHPHNNNFRIQRIQYLISVDEGISYQLSYLNYIQSRGFKKMPFPTHIIFATSSSPLFNYICTNLQLLFIEIEDLTIECKLLPSNINLIPNIPEMVNYYRVEKIREYKKKLKKKLKKKNKKNKNNQSMKPNNNDEEKFSELNDEELLEPNLNNITSSEILQEMEYDILQYLSIPHILYHHNLQNYYENSPNSKLSRKLNKKYKPMMMDSSNSNILSSSMNNNNNKSPLLTHKSSESILLNSNSTFPNTGNEDIQIEMYYAGVPFVSNVLNDVCKICRIPYYTQNIY